jgi:hypothetical protein
MAEGADGYGYFAVVVSPALDAQVLGAQKNTPQELLRCAMGDENLM